MAWKGIVPSDGWTIDQWSWYVRDAQFTWWRPSGLCLHNTGAPTLAQWNGYPEAKRIQNLQRYYSIEQGWSSGPHAFIDNADPCVWPFTPITTPGTHSPSYNATRIGIELVGDFRPGVDDPTTGEGLKVYRNGVAVFGILCAKLGFDPNGETIKFHREDPRTTHRCPGDLLFNLKAKFIYDVREYMSAGGDHPLDDNVIAEPNPTPPEKRSPPEGGVNVDGLNLREESSASSWIITVLRRGVRVAVLGNVLNGETSWSRVWLRDPDNNSKALVGWVATRFLDLD